MLMTTHAVIGAATVSAIPNPYLYIPLAFSSHFFLDAIPHYDPHVIKISKNKKFISLMLVDLFSAIVMSVALICYTQNIYLLIGIFLATIMDLDVLLHLRKSIPKIFPRKLSRYHHKIQNETQSLILGLLTQLLVVLIGFGIIIFIY